MSSKSDESHCLLDSDITIGSFGLDEPFNSHLFLKEALYLPIDVLLAYGLSANTLNMLTGLGVLAVFDLTCIDRLHLSLLALPESEIDALYNICDDVNIEASCRRMKVCHNVESAARRRASGDFADHVLKDATVLPLPSVLLPTNGSTYHIDGTCRPCAWFYHKDGCKNGENCTFCHLCSPGEIRKRKKEKQRILHIIRNARISTASSISSTTSPISESNIEDLVL